MISVLETYKETHFNLDTQFIVIDSNGRVTESDNILFKLKKGEEITTISPFFEGIIDLLEKEENNIKFSCIHIKTANRDLICDIEIKTFKSNPTLIIIYDFTENYKNYQDVAQTRNESVINSQILELKNKYLKEKEDFKNVFIANFSHELRNPFTGITAFCSILQKTELTFEQKDYVEIIKSSADHLKSMMGDILEISQLEVGKLSLDEHLFDFHELIRILEFTYNMKAKQNGVDFNIVFDTKIPQYLEGDKTKLKQILDNLLENAFKFTKKGKVELEVSLNQIRAFRVYLSFSIKDTGIGILKNKLKTIYNSFTQLNNNTKYKGTGLGLTIVKGLVDLMGGEILVKSENRVGTEFKVNLNFKMPIKEKTILLKEKSIYENKKAKRRSKEKYNILLAEDSDLAQMAVLKILATDGSFYLDIVNHGEDVIEYVVQNEYDLILLDIKMPGLSGDVITEMIRELPYKKCKTIPILALTANLNEMDKKRYKKHGMNDIIEKPFDGKMLLKKIFKYLK